MGAANSSAFTTCCCTELKGKKLNEASLPKLSCGHGCGLGHDYVSDWTNSDGLEMRPTYCVTLHKVDCDDALGIDVELIPWRTVLPIVRVTGGLAGKWNEFNPLDQLMQGDNIIEVNRECGNVMSMLDRCRCDMVLEMTVMRGDLYSPNDEHDSTRAGLEQDGL